MAVVVEGGIVRGSSLIQREMMTAKINDRIIFLLTVNLLTLIYRS
ncbi:unnamed protein product [Brassica oleracea var. botrytis]